MGLYITLNIHQVDGDTQFDVGKANADIMAEPHGGLGELFAEAQYDSAWEGPFKVDNGDLLIAQRFEGADWEETYGKQTQCWGCYAGPSFQNIANNIITGKIVFFVEIEGNPNEYYVCTPGKVEKHSQAALTF